MSKRNFSKRRKGLCNISHNCASVTRVSESNRFNISAPQGLCERHKDGIRPSAVSNCRPSPYSQPRRNFNLPGADVEAQDGVDTVQSTCQMSISFQMLFLHPPPTRSGPSIFKDKKLFRRTDHRCTTSNSRLSFRRGVQEMRRAL